MNGGCAAGETGAGRTSIDNKPPQNDDEFNNTAEFIGLFISTRFENGDATDSTATHKFNTTLHNRIS
jgi:hypothetical protein